MLHVRDVETPETPSQLEAIEPRRRLGLHLERRVVERAVQTKGVGDMGPHLLPRHVTTNAAGEGDRLHRRPY